MASADFLIIGGGIAGLSAAARLAPHGRTILFEAEDATGYHASGRSATFAHYGIGNSIVRGLTWFSRAFFQNPPPGFAPVPIAERASALFVATAEMADAKARLHADMSRFTDSIETLERRRGARPVSRAQDRPRRYRRRPCSIPTACGSTATRCCRAISARSKRQAGAVLTSHRIAAIDRAGGDWRVTAESGEQWTAPILVNAAGAWADQVGIAGRGPPARARAASAARSSSLEPPGPRRARLAVREDRHRRILHAAAGRAADGVAGRRSAERSARRAARGV